MRGSEELGSRRTVVSVVVFLCVSASCAPAQSLGERDTDFDIALERSYEKPDGYLVHVTTTNTYPCAGYSINSIVRWDGDTVSVHFLGLLRPSPCVESSDEATGTVFVGDLAGPRVHPVSVPRVH